MTLNCWDVREILWPQDRPRGTHEREAEAKAHVTSCPSCQAFFRRDERLGRRLRKLRDAEIATPPALRERVMSGLEAAPIQGPEAAPRRRSWRSELLTAAAALVLLAGGYALGSRTAGSGSADPFVQDYERTAAMEVEARQLDSESVARFYERELGLRIVPVVLPSAQMLRATVCNLEGRKGAMVEYEMSGARLVHYRLPADQRGAADRHPTGELALASEDGVQVAHWYDGAFENALVSEMEKNRLARLAEEGFRGQ